MATGRTGANSSSRAPRVQTRAADLPRRAGARWDPVWLAPPPPDHWKFGVEFSYVDHSGNKTLRLMTAGLKLSRRAPGAADSRLQHGEVPEAAHVLVQWPHSPWVRRSKLSMRSR